MKPIINPWWIYLAEKSESLSDGFYIVGFLAIIAIVAIILKQIYNGAEIKVPKLIVFIAILGISISNLLPSQKTILTMMTLNQLTENNIKVVGETVEDTIDYIVDKVEKIIDEEE